MLVVDGAAVGLTVAGIAARSEATAGFGGVIYGLGGPALHLIHGSPGKALTSAGLRQVLPAAGFVVGMAMARRPCTGDLCGLSQELKGGLAGLGAGVAAAALLDAFWLAHDDTTTAGFDGHTLSLRARF